MLGKLVNKDNFMAIRQSPNIAQIMSPLIGLKVNFFNHIRIYKDLSRISLSNRCDWLKHFMEMKYYNQGRFSSNPNQFDLVPMSYVLWKTSASDGVVQDARQHFDIDNGFTIIENHGDFKDFFLFASSHENHQVNNFYLNNTDVLEHFICFYKEKAKKIIQVCKPDIYLPNNDNIPDENCDANHKLTVNSNHHNSALNLFYVQTKVKRYYIGGEKSPLYLTNMEYQAAKFIASGLSLKGTAHKLGIQYSTLNTYLNNAKQRLNIYSISSLIDMFNTI